MTYTLGLFPMLGHTLYLRWSNSYSSLLCWQYLQKLRKKEIAAPASGAGASSSATPKTPRKRAPAAKKTPGTTFAGKRKPEVEPEDDGDEATPPKKTEAEPLDLDGESR
jgi:hypothetical protein